MCLLANILVAMGVSMMTLGQGSKVLDQPKLGALSLSSADSPFAFVEETGRWVRLTLRNKPVWQYNYGVATPPNASEINATSGFLHPVWNPAGVVVTDWGPPDHYHHRGIFFAWVNNRWGDLQPDFWNLYKGTGRTRFEAFERLELHPEKAVIITRHIWHAKKGDEWVPVVRERWTLITYAPKEAEPKDWAFDLTTEVVNITDIPLSGERYHYGGIAYRGARVWVDKSKMEVLTSEGKTRADGNEAEARWVLQCGVVDGQWAGVTIMDYPTNFRFPNRLRVNPSIPYVGFIPSQKGSFVMEQNKPLSFRFRFIVHTERPQPSKLDELWQEFASSE